MYGKSSDVIKPITVRRGRCKQGSPKIEEGIVFYISSLDTVSKTQEELFQEAGSSDYMRDMKKAEWKIQLTSI